MDIQELALMYLQDICRRPSKPHMKGNEQLQGERRVLKYLYETKDQALPGEISDYLRLTTARIANILLSLEKKGFIQRGQDPKDRRKVIVCLTEAGKAEAEKERREVLSYVEAMLRYLGEEDARELVRLEARITQMILEAENPKG